jgi:hypothetical protein
MKKLKKTKGEKCVNFQKIRNVLEKLTWSSLARAIFFATSLLLANQNSLANFTLIAKTSLRTRSVPVVDG